MHEKLSKSPITYVLAQVRFTNIESMEKYIPELQEIIRQQFPIFKKITIQAIDLRDRKFSDIIQWHFMDENSVTGILLDGTSISIHTSKYDNFLKLQKQFDNVLTEFNKILNISLCVRLGLRYINLIESNLDKYIQPELLGFHLKDTTHFEKNKFLARTELIQKSKIGIVKIKSTHMGDNEVTDERENIFVPSDMINIADLLSFKHHKKPSKDFSIIDIDHFYEKNEKFEVFDVKEIINDLTRIQDASYNAFTAAVTPRALKDWN
jgi:uncharacterized protein (TIGR04255 family)